jgi:hypothetical protein
MQEGFSKQENKVNKFQKLFELFKRAAIIGMIGLANSQGVEGQYIGHYREVSIAEPSKDKGERKILSSKDIHGMVLHDHSERMFLGDDHGLYEVDGGEKESGLITFDDIQGLIDRGENSPILGHTHPMSAYDNIGYSAEEINEMRSENAVPAPMPPSMTDIIGTIDTLDYFNGQNIKIRGRVYDPTGMWEYKIDPNNHAVRLFIEFKSKLNANIEDALTEEERKVMEEFGINKIHPAKRIEVLKSDPRTINIGRKLEMAASNYFESLSEESKANLEKFAQLEIIVSGLAEAQKLDKQDRTQQLIQNYIRAGSDIGVQVVYVANR